MSEGERAPEGPTSVVALGKYLVLAELGRGGMAEVYLALSRGPNGFHKLVVLKLLRTHLAEDHGFLEMFLSEARLAARLNHAHIVQTYEIGVEGGRHAIVMEYLEGRSLSEVEEVAGGEPLPLNLGLRVLSSTLAALHYAHELRDVNGQPLDLVHRDVSPQNVLITYDGQVKLLDFGIAKAASDASHTKTGVFKGKLRYTSPGRFIGEENDRRSDLFSVGVMLWQLLTRRRLWQGMNEGAVMKELAKRSPIPAPRSVDPTIPEKLDAICNKALAISADERFQTAAEMEEALEDYLANESGGVTSRAMARFMEERFGEKRARFRETLDEQIRVAAGVPLEPQRFVSSSRLRAQGVPQLGTATGSDSFSRLRTLEGASSVGDVEGSVSIVLSAPPPGPPPSSPAELSTTQPRSRASLAVGLLVLAAVAAALFVLARRAPPPPPAEAAPITAVPPSTPAPRPAIAVTSSAAPVVTAPPPLSSASPSTSAAPVTRPLVNVSPRGHSSPSPARPAPAAAQPEPVRREASCASPYFIDDQGVKKIRPECL
jgi:tRNA A-37 threonylcarbamoyl transferase component Bud32